MTIQNSNSTITLRAVISAIETIAAAVATVMFALNNGADTHHGFLVAGVAGIMHSVNHNAGGSPV